MKGFEGYYGSSSAIQEGWGQVKESVGDVKKVVKGIWVPYVGIEGY